MPVGELAEHMGEPAAVDFAQFELGHQRPRIGEGLADKEAAPCRRPVDCSEPQRAALALPQGQRPVEFGQFGLSPLQTIGRPTRERKDEVTP